MNVGEEWKKMERQENEEDEKITVTQCQKYECKSRCFICLCDVSCEICLWEMRNVCGCTCKARFEVASYRVSVWSFAKHPSCFRLNKKDGTERKTTKSWIIQQHSFCHSDIRCFTLNVHRLSLCEYQETEEVKMLCYQGVRMERK